MSKQSMLFLFILLAITAAFIAAGPAEAAVVYNGDGDMVDGIEDGKVWGSPTFANDHLLVIVSGRFAWNHWNGVIPGGSGTIWHYGFTRVENQWVLTWSQGIVKTEGLPPFHLWVVR